eukprot:SM000044S15969  [mRNA]  locus=s44:285073:288988:+ [translate_table: standard]
MGPKKKRSRPPSFAGQPSRELETLARQVQLLAADVGPDDAAERAPKAIALRALSRLRRELLRRQLDGAAAAGGAGDDPAVLQLLRSHALPQSLANLLQSSKAKPALQQVVLEVVGIAALSSVAASETLASCGALLRALVEAMHRASSSSCRVLLAALSAATTIATASLGCKELLHCGAVPALLSVAAWAGRSSGQPPVELQCLPAGGQPGWCKYSSDASPRTSDRGVSTTSAPLAKATIAGARKTGSGVGGKRALVVEAAADALQLLLYSAKAEEATVAAAANAPDKAATLALVAFQEQLWSYYPLAALSGSRLQRTVQSLAKVVAYLALLCPVSQPQLHQAPGLLWTGREDMGTSMVVGKPPPFLHGGERSLEAQLADVLDCEEAAAEDFLRCHWEQAPLLLIREERTSSSRPVRSSGGQISKLHQVLGLHCAEDAIELVSLGVHCPAFRADEMDALVALREAAAELGLPMLHEQDLNLVACGKEAPGGDGSGGPAKGIAGEECAQALALGYTLALRGLQFRSHNVATIAVALAAAMGQAAVGANLYLTPEGSQGLEAHYDDHCVFVCQLAGQKQWKVFPAQVQLPRLYSVRSRSQVDNNVHPCIFNLQPGDVLYIPRGWPHEALNLAQKGNCNSSEPSLHITFGVEVESPFEWEGLLHIALHLRCQELAHDHNRSDEVLSTGKLGVGTLASDQELHGTTERGHLDCGDLHGHDPAIVVEGLLHVAVRAVGNRHEQLRRTCLTSAAAAGNDAARLETSFCSVLKLVVSEASFEEACDIVSAFLIAEAMAASGTASEVNAGSSTDLGWMTWLTHIPASSAAISKPGARHCHPAALLGCPALFAGLAAPGWRASDEAAALRQRFDAAVLDLTMLGAADLSQVLAVRAALLAAYCDTRARLGNALASLHPPFVDGRSAAL